MVRGKYWNRVRVAAGSCLVTVALVLGCLAGGTPAAADSQGPSASSSTAQSPSVSQGGSGISQPIPEASTPGNPTGTGLPLEASQPSVSDPQGKASNVPQSPTAPTKTSPDSSRSDLDSSTSPTATKKSHERHTVSFDLNGGAPPAPEQQSILDGGMATRPSKSPTKEGYIFDGWFTGAVGYDFAAPVRDNLTLQAHWTEDDPVWGMSPTSGPTSGGTNVTLTPPNFTGVRYTRVISYNAASTMAIATDGHAYAWGITNTHGEYGLGNTDKQYVPTPVELPDKAPSDFTYINAFIERSNAYLFGSDGNLYATGSNTSGKIGNGTRDEDLHALPTLVSKPAGVPADFTFTQITSSRLTTVALGSDGNIYAWGGFNPGNPNTPTRLNKPDGVGDDFSFTSISSGSINKDFLFLGSDGNIYKCSTVVWKGLGSESELLQQVPKPKGAGEDFTYTRVLGGSTFNKYAFGSDGKLYGWGSNPSGTLGDGTNTPRTTPVAIEPPSGSDINFVDAGFGNEVAFALGSDRNIYAWGHNLNGRLGTGLDDEYFTVPTLVQKPSSAPSIDYITVTATLANCYAIGSNGLTYGWGSDGTALGIDSTVVPGDINTKSNPVEIKNPGQGRIRNAWFGTSPTTAPPVRNVGGTWTVVTPSHESGSVPVTVDWLWGGGVQKYSTTLNYLYVAPKFYTITFDKADGSAAQTKNVSDGDRVNRPDDPKRQDYEFDGWFIGSTATPYDFSRPVINDLTLMAHWSPKENNRWKMNPSHGPESGGTRVTLTAPARRGIRLSQMSAGENYSVAVGSDGNAWAWGSNQNGQLGNGTTSDQVSPIKVAKPDGVASTFTYTHVSAGKNHVLAIGSDGNIYTWGSNQNGQLGIDSTTDQSTPRKINKPQGVDTPITFTQISAGDNYSLAIDSTGALYAWGINDHGQLGDGTHDQRTTPVTVRKPEGTATEFVYTHVSAGQEHALALGYDNHTYGWGRNTEGQVKPGQDGDLATPTQIQNSHTFTQVSAGSQFSLGLTADGSIYSWGQALKGQLGTTCETASGGCAITQVQNPSNIGGRIFYRQIATGMNFSLAASSDGKVWAWGNNSSGELGNGNTTSTTKPTQVSSITTDTVNDKPLSAGDGLSLAIASDGNAYAWGANTKGQLGIDNQTSQTRPHLVNFLLKNKITNFTFDGKPITPEPKTDTENAWQFTTPEHQVGSVNTKISWTNNEPQPDADYLTYVYDPIGKLPKAGGPGILLFLIIGLATITITLVHHQLKEKKI